MDIQQSLLDFHNELTANPDITDEQLLEKHSFLANDPAMLQSAFDYSATLNTGKKPEQINDLFPELGLKKKDGIQDLSMDSKDTSQLPLESQSEVDPIWALLKKKQTALEKKQAKKLGSMPIAPGAVPLQQTDDTDIDAEVSGVDAQLKEKAKALKISYDKFDDLYKDVNDIKSLSLNDDQIKRLLSLKDSKPQTYGREIANIKWIDSVRSAIGKLDDPVKKQSALSNLDAIVERSRSGGYGEGKYANNLSTGKDVFQFIMENTTGDQEARDKAIKNFKADFIPALGRALIQDGSALTQITNAGSDYPSQIASDIASIFDQEKYKQINELKSASFTDPSAKQAKERKQSEFETEGLSVISSGIKNYIESKSETFDQANKAYEKGKPELDKLESDIIALQAQYKDDPAVKQIGSLTTLYKRELERFNEQKQFLSSNKGTRDDYNELKMSFNLLKTINKNIQSVTSTIQAPDVKDKVKQFNDISNSIKGFSNVYDDESTIGKWNNYIDNKFKTQFQRYPATKMDQIMQTEQDWNGSNFGFFERFAINLAGQAENASNLVGIAFDNLFLSEEKAKENNYARIGRSSYLNNLSNYNPNNESLIESPVVTVFGDEAKKKLQSINDSNLSKEEKEKQTNKIIEKGITTGSIYRTTNPNAGKFNLTTTSVLNTISTVAPQILAQMGFSWVTGGLGTASTAKTMAGLATSTFMQGFSSYYDEAVNNGISNPTQYAMSHSLIDMGTEVIGMEDLNTLKSAFKNSKGFAAKFFRDLSESQFDELLKGSKNVFKDFKGSVAKQLKSNIGEGFEESLAQVLGNATDRSMFNEDVKLFEGAGDAFAQTVIGQLPLTALGIPISYNKTNIGSKFQLYNIGANSEYMRGIVNDQLVNGEISQIEADKRIKVIEGIAKSVSELPQTYENGMPLKDDDKAKIAFNNFNIEMSKNGLSTLPEAQQSKVKETVEAIQNENSAILSSNGIPTRKSQGIDIPFEVTTYVEGKHQEEYNAAIDRLVEQGMTPLQAGKFITTQIAKELNDRLPELLESENIKTKVLSIVPSEGGYTNTTSNQYDISPNIIITLDSNTSDADIRRIMETANKAADQQSANAFRIATPEELESNDPDVHGMVSFEKPEGMTNEAFQKLMFDLHGVKDSNGKSFLTGHSDFGSFIGIGGHFYEGQFGNEFEKNIDQITKIFSENGVNLQSVQFNQNKVLTYDRSTEQASSDRQNQSEIGNESGVRQEGERLLQQTRGIYSDVLKRVAENKQAREQTRVEKIITNVQKALNATGISIKIIDDQSDFENETGQKGLGGVFIAQDGTILLNKQSLENSLQAGRIIFHEGAHPVMNIIRNTNRELYNKVVSGLKEAAKNNPTIQGTINWADSNYDSENTDLVNDEALVETIAMIADGSLKLANIETGLRQSIIDFINKIAQVLGLPTVDDTDIEAFKKVASQVATALQQGNNISEIVGDENINKYQNTNVQSRKTLEELKNSDVESRVVSGVKVSTRTPSAKTSPTDVHNVDTYIVDLKSSRLNAPNYINNAIEISKYPIIGEVKKSDIAALERGLLSKSKGGNEEFEKKALSVSDKIYEKFIRVVADNLAWLHDHFNSDLRDVAHRWYDGANVIAQEFSSRFNVSQEQASGVIAVLSPQMDWYKNVSLAERVLDIVKNKSEFVFDQKMADTLVYLSDKIIQGKNETDDQFNKRKIDVVNEAKEIVKQVIGKPLNANIELFPKTLRVYDETYNSKSYPILSPNGDIIELATNKDGSNSSIGWQGYATIAKAISIISDGSKENISKQLGDMHKVRNFYNNISDPNSKNGDVTIDTHAVAAGLLKPLAGSDPEVIANLSGKSSAITGSTGTYAAFADAYRLAAKEKGILPRQMQSIVWEAVRGLFKDTWKTKANKTLINDLWGDYLKGKISIDETRKRIDEYAGGVEIPNWARYGSEVPDITGQTNNSGELSTGSNVGSDRSRGGNGNQREAKLVPKSSEGKEGRIQARVDNKEEQDRGFAKTYPYRDPETVSRIGDEAKTYFAISNAETNEEVRKFIEGREPEDVLDYLLNQPNDIPSRVRIWMSGVVMDLIDTKINEANENGDRETAIRLAEKQAQLIDQIAPLGTELGQAIQAFRRFYENAGSSPAMLNYYVNKIIAQVEKEKGTKVTNQERSKIEELAQQVVDANNGLPKDEATFALGNYIGSIVPVNPADLLEAIWYAHILSGITTQSNNFFANFWNTFAEGIVTGIRESVKSKSMMPFLMGAKGFIGGLQEGAIEAKDILFTGVSDHNGDKFKNKSLLEYFSWKQTKFGKLANGKVGAVLDYSGGLSPKLLKYVGRALAAVDAMYSRSNAEAISRVTAYSIAMQEGKAGITNDINKRAQELLFNTKQNAQDAFDKAKSEGFIPATTKFKRRLYEITVEGRDSELNKIAEDYGGKVTLNYEPEGFMRPIYKAALALQKSNRVTKMFIPFTRIVVNLTENSLNYAGGGYYKAIRGTTSSEAGRRKLTMDERADFAIKSTLGLAAFVLLAAKTGDKEDDWFEITANGTGDPQKNYELQQSGWRPYSIKLKSGRFISYKDWPIMPVLAAVGAMHDHDKYIREDEPTPQAMIAAAGMVNSLWDKSIMKGLQDMMEVLSPKQEYNQSANLGQRMVSWGADQAKSLLISNFTQQTIKMTQEYMDSPVKAAKGIDRIYRDIPYFNDHLNPILNVFGEPVKPSTSERLLPITVKKPSSDQLLQFFNEMGVFIGKPRSVDIYTDDEGNTRPMTDKEYFEYTKLSGKLTKQYLIEEWEDIMEAINEATTEKEKKEIAKKIIGNVTSAARNEALEPYYE